MCVSRKCWGGTKIVAEINLGYFLSTYDFFNYYYYIYIYLFHTQSTHIDKSYINSNTIIHIINDKYIIMSGHISVNKILRNNHI